MLINRNKAKKVSLFKEILIIIMKKKLKIKINH